MQFEIGTSTRRYLPPSGTAGFERWAVSGNKRVPAPPPRITASMLRFRAIGTLENRRKVSQVSRGWQVKPGGDAVLDPNIIAFVWAPTFAQFKGHAQGHSLATILRARV